MENDINQILATKRAWRTAERRRSDRRIKDGSIEDRKNLADALRAGRQQTQDHLKFCTCSACDAGFGAKRPLWFSIMRKLGLIMALILILSGCVQADQGLRIVQIAESQIGKGEIGGDNKGPEVRKYTRGKEVAWCSGFVSWVRSRAGYEGTYILHARSYWTSSRIRTTKPKPGDVIVFRRGGHGGHVGIVEKVQGQTITTIEGNVGPYPAKVKRQTYTIGHIQNLLGFVRVI